jgi:hypothetical protein
MRPKIALCASIMFLGSGTLSVDFARAECRDIVIMGWDHTWDRHLCAEATVKVEHSPTSSGIDHPPCANEDGLVSAKDVQKKIDE